jgi:hypothetical protein
VPIAQPGNPIKMTEGEPDLALKDGTLVETKWRKGTLAWDEQLHKQLLKYDRAVIEGKYKRIRIECNGPVSQQVRDRCKVIADRGSPIEILENVGWGP